jgi:hypothetical protein
MTTPMPPCSPHCAGSFILLTSFTPGEPIKAQACAPAASATTGALLTRAPDRSAPIQQRSLGSDLLRSDVHLGPSGLDAMAESSYQEYSTSNSRATSALSTQPNATSIEHMHAVSGRAEKARVDASGAAAMSADEMITCLGSCRARWEIAAMIKALSLHPWLNTPAEAKRLEAARAAMGNWKSYSHACQARHNAHRLRLSHR